ncbi:M23 family metallopeptidase [Streptomyces sp. CB03238]|uniref:M23 family metallopeptidase n=1 Tax=Streptomyces sp. CB03238 TaxID=1907777 RepID=UPI000A11218F|nr:M23 family metallopeptidase [Streptomyces sp. CB03238]ORT53767.1 peptidase [Streptomyces sp. CB03238]
MAFTRATGKHRAPSRPGFLSRKSAHVAGVAALATTGVVGSLASPALAANKDAAPLSLEDTGLNQAIITDTLAERVDAQAEAQELEAQEAAAKAAAQAKAEAEAKRKAEARVKAAREAKERADREAERQRLNAFQLPVAGTYVSTGYQTGGAMWSSGSHTGIDFHAASGSRVVSVGAGTVVEAGWGGAYGNNIVIRMNDGTYTQYGHLSSINVSVGQTVMPGQQIGLSGSTGNSSGPHLHFEARTSAEYGSDIDPVAYLRSHGVNV